MTKELLRGKTEPKAPPAVILLYEALPSSLKSALSEKQGTFTVILSRQLGMRHQTVYGHIGYRLERTPDTHSGIWLWQVARKKN